MHQTLLQLLRACEGSHPRLAHRETRCFLYTAISACDSAHADAMQNLDRLSATGLPVFDLNSEHLDQKDWSRSPLGSREKWPVALQCLVNSCILPMPHCAAIFWGERLTAVHNLAWEKARGDKDGQGTVSEEAYGDEALGTLLKSFRGRTVKVGKHRQLPDIPKPPANAHQPPASS